MPADPEPPVRKTACRKYCLRFTLCVVLIVLAVALNLGADLLVDRIPRFLERVVGTVLKLGGYVLAIISLVVIIYTFNQLATYGCSAKPRDNESHSHETLDTEVNRPSNFTQECSAEINVNDDSISHSPPPILLQSTNIPTTLRESS